MNRFQNLRLVLVLFVAIQIVGCSNESLDGPFIQQLGVLPAEPGEFVANVAGQPFIADSIRATLSLDNQFEISGKMGDALITLAVVDAAEATFLLDTTDSNLNYGLFLNDVLGENPYITEVLYGGSGKLVITDLDRTNRKVSGKFNFIAKRIARDELGNPILDGSGLPSLETIVITLGSFNDITLELENDGNPADSFFALTDGDNFNPTSLSLIETMVGNEPMFSIMAKKANNEMIRIDLPKYLGDGTFDMERISDGTKLIGIYNDGVGGDNLTSNPGTITLTQFNIETGFLVGTFSFTATDPLNESGTAVAVTEGSFSFIFEGTSNGNSFLNTYIDTSYYNAEAGVATDTIINGFPAIYLKTQVGNERINLTLPETIEVGTYPMAGEFSAADKVVGRYQPIDGANLEFVSNPGTMEILEIDRVRRVVRGSFSFFAKDPTQDDDTIYRLTAGRFKAKY